MIKTFINLPVKNLANSIIFFTELGFKFEPKFTDDKATCMVISDDCFVMLLTEEFFKSFTKKKLADSTQTTEVIIAVSVDSKEAVDEMANKAFKSGGTPANDKINLPHMYGWSFQDLDGHFWEVFYMDPNFKAE